MSTFRRGYWIVDTDQQLAWRVQNVAPLEEGDLYLSVFGTVEVWGEGEDTSPRIKVMTLRAPEGYRFMEGMEDRLSGDRFFHATRTDFSGRWGTLEHGSEGQRASAIYARKIDKEPSYRPMTRSEFVDRYGRPSQGFVYAIRDEPREEHMITSITENGVSFSGGFWTWGALADSVWHDAEKRHFRIEEEN